MHEKELKQPWLAEPLQECLLVLAPSIIPVIIVFLFKDYFENHEVSSVWWLLLVLCIDVSHVYSTLFRLYWDRPTFHKYKTLLIIIPAVAFVLGFGLHYYDPMIFWRVMAYIAAYHFIRQQYGFMRLYSRTEDPPQVVRWIDTIAIYNATLYPLLYWHFHLTRELSWFVPGDFIPLGAAVPDTVLTAIFLAILLIYVAKEVWMSYSKRLFNVPKNLIVLGTYASWYVGIVMFQGDLIFTFLNVVAHGIPYMGLIWIYGEKKASRRFKFNGRGVIIFIGILIGLAYLEESIWDIFVWKDHPDIFPFLTTSTGLSHPLFLSIIVPILVLPQLTHYVLDGFIWRFSKDPSSRLAGH